MDKLDLRKQYKHLYLPSSKQVTVVEVPAFQFAMIDGAIEPGHEPGNSPSFQQALEALYGIAYTLKFMSKLREENSVDYTVMALEGLWWVEDGEFDITNPGNWYWTAMILQPEHITQEMCAQGLEQLRIKKPNPALDKMRLERFDEGLCMQIMHIGPFSEEGPTIERMHQYAFDQGYELRGKHHEIYLSDPRRTAQEKLRTVIRQPIKKV